MIQMQSSQVDTNNTGRVHIAFGYQPVAEVGHASQGEVLLQASAIDEPQGNRPLDEQYKQAVWATSSQDNQSLIVEEEVE